MTWSNVETGVIRAALETIDEAFAIYDPDDRLVAFNHRYAALRSAVGGEVVVGARWNDLIEASVRAGAIPEAIGREDAWLEQRRRVRGAYSVVRQTPDRRFYRVTERRMSNGGIAVMWTDITRRTQPNQSGEREVFIVCSRRMMREAFQLLLESVGLVVIGTASSFADLLALAAMEKKPNLIISLMDSEQDVQEVPRLLKETRALYTGTKIMMVTKGLPPSILRAIVQTGIEAILTTEVSSTVLLRTVDLVLLDQRVLSAEVTQSLDGQEGHSEFGRPRRGIFSETQQNLPPKRSIAFSQRERGILQLLADGRPNKAIARELSLTEATVKVHIKNLLRKTQTANRTQAAIWSLSSGLCQRQAAQVPLSIDANRAGRPV